MDIRKKIRLIALVLSVAVISGFVFFATPKNKSSQNVSQKPGRASNSQPDNLNQTQSAVLVNKIVKVGSGSAPEIKAAFVGLLHQANSASNSKPLFYAFKDSQNKTVTLDSFSKALGIRVPSQIAERLDQAGYEVASCGQGKVVLIGNVDQANDDPYLYPKLQGQLKEWESTMLVELAGFLYPELERNVLLQANPKLEFKDNSSGRFAKITLPNSVQSTLAYELTDWSSLILGNSSDCVKNVATQLNGDSD